MASDNASLIASAIVIVGAIGALVAYFWKARGDSVIKYQAVNIKDRDDRIAFLEKDNAAIRAENQLLRDQNSKLSDLAQGSPQLKQLTKAVETLAQTVNAKISTEVNK